MSTAASASTASSVAAAASSSTPCCGSASHGDEPRSEHLDVDLGGGQALLEHRQEPLLAGQVQRRGRALGDVGGGAPAAAIVGVDELQRQRPVAARIVGQRQAQAGPNHRLALTAADGLLEDRRQVVERLGELGVGAELADG